MKYFVSDLHFGHRNILRFERSEFANVKDHDDKIMEVLKKPLEDDELYILGDIGEIPDAFRKLKCKIYLLKGNHDRKSRGYYKGFNINIIDYPLFLTKRILLSHEPYPITDEMINVHGHLHNATINKSNYLNVNIHLLGYRLLTEKELLMKVEKIPKISQKFMQEWYADLYKFENKSKK